MSYQLSFWHEVRQIDMSAQEIFGRLIEGDEVTGLATLETDDLVAKIAAALPDWIQHDGRSFESSAQRGAFELFTTAQSITATCYGMKGSDMNRLIDLARGFDLRLYDPQTNERFA